MTTNEDLDPFLIAHRVGNGAFDMAGKYSPAAVRDQMNRAVAIVERAFRTRVLGRGDKFLIKGCGAAAVSAAMRAVSVGVASVTLSQREGDEFFGRQRHSGRFIDPVEYDWPAEGWESGARPASGRVPLPYGRDRAKAVVVRQWDPAWEAFRDRHKSQLWVVASAQVDEAAFERVLDCTGPGDERTQVGRYRWFGFWSDDELEYPGVGRVLISGGGDGALQDFLRILFPGMSPRDIYNRLGMSVAERLWLEWRILNAEDRARRSWVWSADLGIDCGVLAELQSVHAVTAGEVLPGVRRKLEELLSGRTTELDRIWLAFECNHFGPCYAFNRFSVLLVDAYCVATGVGSPLLGGRRLVGVVSGDAKGHSCAGVTEECLGHPHRAEFTESSCRLGVGGSMKPSEAYDVVVVRHGIDGGAKRLSRQALPYELPEMP